MASFSWSWCWAAGPPSSPLRSPLHYSIQKILRVWKKDEINWQNRVASRSNTKALSRNVGKTCTNAQIPHALCKGNSLFVNLLIVKVDLVDECNCIFWSGHWSYYFSFSSIFPWQHSLEFSRLQREQLDESLDACREQMKKMMSEYSTLKAEVRLMMPSPFTRNILRYWRLINNYSMKVHWIWDDK